MPPNVRCQRSPHKSFLSFGYLYWLQQPGKHLKLWGNRPAGRLASVSQSQIPAVPTPVTRISLAHTVLELPHGSWCSPYWSDHRHLIGTLTPRTDDTLQTRTSAVVLESRVRRLHRCCSCPLRTGRSNPPLWDRANVQAPTSPPPVPNSAPVKIPIRCVGEEAVSAMLNL